MIFSLLNIEIPLCFKAFRLIDEAILHGINVLSLFLLSKFGTELKGFVNELSPIKCEYIWTKSYLGKKYVDCFGKYGKT